LIEMEAIVKTERGWRSLASVTWIAGRAILADARAYNLVNDGEPPDDYVMPPGADSLGLTRVAPLAPRGRTLDLCCGSGVQALVAAASSDEAVGVDVNPRALRFARVNAAANRAANVTFVQGDTYEPLRGERFDAILANPPFVPWPGDANLLFRGGGVRGDDVLARILRGVATHLAPGGSLAIVADFVNVDDLAARLAAWQGASLRTLLLLERHYALLDYAELHAAHLDGDERGALVVRLLQHYEAHGIRTVDYGYLVQDGEAGRTHAMRTASALAGPIADDVAAGFAHQCRFARGGIDHATLLLAPGLRLVRTTTTEAGGGDERYAVEPGPASMLEAVPVTPRAFRLLERVAAGDLRPAEMDDVDDVRALAHLLDGGWVRIQA
jgi:carbamoyltransferase